MKCSCKRFVINDTHNWLEIDSNSGIRYDLYFSLPDYSEMIKEFDFRKITRTGGRLSKINKLNELETDTFFCHWCQRFMLTKNNIKDLTYICKNLKKTSLSSYLESLGFFIYINNKQWI